MSEVLDPASRIRRLIERQEPKFASGFLLLVGQIKDSIDLEQIEDLLSKGMLEQAFTETLRRVPSFGTLYIDSFIAAAKSTAEFFNQKLDNIVIDFDQTNQFAVRVMQEEKLRLIREFTQQQREATRQALLDGIARGNNPKQQARVFRDSIGLTHKQHKAVEKFRQLLEEGNRDVLNRALRDRRFDSTIRNAIRNGTPLTEDQIDVMVDRYRERFIKYRSEVIARTESLRSVNQGNHAMYQQAIENGDLDPNNMTTEWNTAKDERVRDSHSTMHGQKVPYGQMFTSGKGHQTLYPGGFGIAQEDIQCRCAVGTRIVQVPVPAGLTAEIIGF